MATITIPGMFLTGDHASRPAANAVGDGTLYSCSDHALIYQSDGSSWTTWATLGTASAVVPWALVPIYGAGHAGFIGVGSNNRAIYVPVVLPAAATVTGVRLSIASQSGNISVGMYDSAGNRVATSGAIACPAAANSVTVNFSASYAAAAGRYYLGLSADNTVATFGNVNGANGEPVLARYGDSSHPLPATATFTGPTGRHLVLVGLISGGHP